MKTCTQCRRELPVTAFYRLNTGKPRPACKDCYYDRTLAYKRRFPLKSRAHRAVRKAVASGRLRAPKQCACGATSRLSAHHDDYSRPLDVIWLCGSCHKARHAVIERAAQAA